MKTPGRLRSPPLHATVAMLTCAAVPAQKSAACGAVTRHGNAVVNADQTVIMVWDEARRTQHFIRQASFKSDANDVGFIVPTPSVLRSFTAKDERAAPGGNSHR